MGSRLWVVGFGGGLLSLRVALLGLGGLQLRLLCCGRWGCDGGFVGGGWLLCGCGAAMVGGYYVGVGLLQWWVFRVFGDCWFASNGEREREREVNK